MITNFRRMPKIAYAIGLALVSQSALAEVTGDFSSTANSFISSTETAIKLSITNAANNQLAFIDDIDSEAEPQALLWTNVTWDSTVGRTDATLFDLLNGPNTLTLSTLTLKDMDLDPGTTGFEFHGTNTALVLNNASVNLLNQPGFRDTSQLSLRSEGTGTSTISRLTGDQGSPTAIDVASGTTLQFFQSGRLDNGLPDSSRANFDQSNSAVINGTLDINQSYVIFNTGPGKEMLVNSGGQLTLFGSQTVLETGDLRVNGGTVALGIGGARLEANDITLTDATVNVGASSTVESSGNSLASGANTIDLGNNARYSTDLLGTNGASVTISGTGTVSTPRVAFVQSGDRIAITESATLEVTSGAGNPQLLDIGGRIDIGANATFDIQAGAAVVAELSTIHNDGLLRVSGSLEPRGMISGDGIISVTTGGHLGVFGGYNDDYMRTTNDVFLEALSTLKVALSPDEMVSQKLITSGDFEINSTVGAYLDLIIPDGDDASLAAGTKFAIVDYSEGDSWGGFFLRDDNSTILDGGLITEGLNTFRLSYNDGDYISGTSSFITLTTVPVPAAVWLFGSGLLGLIGVARRKKAA